MSGTTTHADFGLKRLTADLWRTRAVRSGQSDLSQVVRSRLQVGMDAVIQVGWIRRRR